MFASPGYNISFFSDRGTFDKIQILGIFHNALSDRPSFVKTVDFSIMIQVSLYLYQNIQTHKLIAWSKQNLNGEETMARFRTPTCFLVGKKYVVATSQEASLATR